MEELSNLESLPFEVLGHIANYLDLQEILHCCATSSCMRQAFGDDLVWKKKCDLDMVNYLENNKICYIEPCTEWVELNEQSTLLPVSRWRKGYMMQTRLLNNWRHGRYEKEEIKFGEDGTMFNCTEVLFHETDFLLLHTELVKENQMLDEIWNVGGTPFLHSTFNIKCDQYLPIPYVEETNINQYKIVNKKLVVAQNNAVLVFDVSLTSFSHIPLNDAFLFNNPRVRLVTNSKIISQVKTVVSGKFFIGITLASLPLNTDAIIHIWNIETNEKVKEESISSANLLLGAVNILKAENEKDIIVKLVLRKNRYMYHYYGYNLSKMEYSSFLVKLNYCEFLILAKNRVVGAAQANLCVYNYETSVKMLVKKINHDILKKTLVVSGDNLLFGTFESIVYVMNLQTLDFINSVKLGFTLYSLQAISDKFVVINTTSSEVWQIGKTARKLFKIPNDGTFAAVNQYCSKVAIEKDNRLIILNFW